MAVTETSKYEMWLTYNAEAEKIQLPVHPERLQIENGSSNDSVNIVGLGEVVIMQSRPALRFSFSSFFPATPFPGIQVQTLTPPLTLVQKLNTWKAGKKPVHFIVTTCGIDIFCTIENFTYYEEGGDPGTYQYTLELKEYREIAIRSVTVDTENQTATVEPQDAAPRVDNTVQPKTYTVKPGDCLFNIAKKLYGNGNDYKKIYAANRDIIGGNPNLIYAGQVFTIP